MQDDVDSVIAVRFERLNVLSQTIEDVASELRQHPDKSGMIDEMVSRMQSASAFMTRELREAEQEYLLAAEDTD